MTTLAKNLPLDQIIDKTNEPVRQVCPIQVIKQAKNSGTIRITTSAYDREDDRVFPRGGQLDNYRANPVVQWGHKYEEPWQTIGRTISLDVQDEWIDVEFELRPAANEHDPQNIILLLWEGNWIRTASIGFKPLKVKGNDRSAYDFTQWELLEWSLVPIPANQEALRLAMKSLQTKERTTIVPPVHKELSLDSLVEAVFQALYRALYTEEYWRSSERIDQRPVAVYATYGIVQINLEYYRVEYTIEEGKVKLQERDEWALVDRTWVETLDESAFAKSHFAQLVKADPRHSKAGARHSKADSAAIQAIHDHAVSLGATCEETDSEEAEEKSVTPAEVVIEQPEPEPEPEMDVAPLLAALRSFNGALKGAA